MPDQAFGADLVLADLRADSLEAAFDLVLEALKEQRYLSPAEGAPAREALLSREAVGSTALGNAVQVSHARLPERRRSLLCVARLHPPGLPPGPDGKAVRLLFLYLGPDTGPGDEDLARLQKISKAARDPAWVESCLNAPGPEGFDQRLKAGLRRRREDV